MEVNDDILHTFRVRIKFGPNSDGLTCKWIDDNLKGVWAIGKNTDSYDLHFEYEEDAMLVWWKWG